MTFEEFLMFRDVIMMGCFNGNFDGIEPPYKDVDFYIRLQNDICIYVYGLIPHDDVKELNYGQGSLTFM